MRVIQLTLVACIQALIHNGDGTGGAPPPIYQYVMLNGDETGADYTGFDPAAAHAVVTQDNGYILVGSGITTESPNGNFPIKCLALTFPLIFRLILR